MIKLSDEEYLKLILKREECDALAKRIVELSMEIDHLKKSKSKGTIHKAVWTRENREENVTKDRGV